MRLRALAAACVLLGLFSVTIRADDPPADKKEKAPPPPIERADLDKRIAKIAHDSSLAGSRLWEAKNYEGCFRLYQGTLLALQPLLDHHVKLAALVKDRLAGAEDLDAVKGAFLLREALDAIQKEATATLNVPKKTLWDRLGGEKPMRAVIHDAVEAAMKDPKVDFTRAGKVKLNAKDTARMEEMIVELVSLGTGGPLQYSGTRTLKTAHTGMKITEAEFNAVVGHIADALKKHKVPSGESIELLELIGSTKADVVGQ